MLDPTSPTFWPTLWATVWQATLDTFYMTGLTLVFTILIGLPLGLLLVSTDRGGLLARLFGSAALGRVVHSVLDFVVNVGRSLPFIILMVAITPFTRLVMGGISIGATAAVVPLTVAAVPFFARLVEIGIREVDGGLTEAAQSMGASSGRIIWRVLVPEAMPAMILGLSTTVISVINYSAMAGTIGAGGLGDIAIRYGYQRFSPEYMGITVLLLIIIVQVVQAIGGWAAKKLSHR